MSCLPPQCKWRGIIITEELTLERYFNFRRSRERRLDKT